MSNPETKTVTLKFRRRLVAKGVDEDLCDLGPGVLYEDTITYEVPPETTEKDLAEAVVRDTADIVSKLVTMEVDEVKESEPEPAPESGE